MTLILTRNGVVFRPTKGSVEKAIADREVLRAFVPTDSRADAVLSGGDGGDQPTGTEPIECVISTGSIDRHGTIVDPRGGDFAAYLKNPVVLCAHESDKCVVGNVTEISRSDKEITAKVLFDTESEKGQELDRLYRTKMQRGWSIGFIPHEALWEMLDGVDVLRYSKWELVELSAVAVPSNRDALTRMLKDAGGEQLEFLKQFEPGGELSGLIEKDADEPDQEPGVTQERQESDPSGDPVDDMDDDDVEPVLDPVRSWPVEWEAAFDIDAEMKSAANEEVRKAMACLTVQRGSSVQYEFVHHHADGRISWRMLATQMARLLTESINLTAEQLDSAYEHLAEHYRELGVEVPEGGARTPDQAYDLALQGRIAHIDGGYGWLFVEPVEKSGEVIAAGFQRVDDLESLREFPLPQPGRLTDHRLWGKRRHVDISGNEATLAEIVRLQRELLDHQVRVGAKFSRATKNKITELAASVESQLDSVRGLTEQLDGVAKALRDMVGSMDDEDSSDSGQKDASGSIQKRATQTKRFSN